MMAAEVSNMTYNHVDVPDAFHALSHHQNNAAKLERLVRVQTYHTRAFAQFVQKLAGHAGRRRLDARPLDPRCTAAT